MPRSHTFGHHINILHYVCDTLICCSLLLFLKKYIITWAVYYLQFIYYNPCVHFWILVCLVMLRLSPFCIFKFDEVVCLFLSNIFICCDWYLILRPKQLFKKIHCNFLDKMLFAQIPINYYHCLSRCWILFLNIR